MRSDGQHRVLNVSRVGLALVVLLAMTPVVAQELIIAPYQGDPVLQRQQEQKRLEEQKAREEAVRREQQLVDDELARRGWPRSRETEVRKFIQLQKEAAALKPKPGAGSLLVSSSNAQDDWARRREEAANSGDKPSAVAQPVDLKPSTAKKSNCWMEEVPSKSAAGWSRESEAAARAMSLANTKGCKIVADTFCSSQREGTFNKDGTFKTTGRLWDCRTGYQCGESQKRCQNEPAAASAQ